MIKEDNRDQEVFEAENPAADDCAKDFSSEESAVEASAPALPPEKPQKQPRQYGKGTAIAAFIFFAITACVFAFYEYFAITFLYMPFANGVNDIGEAIAAIFGYTFGLVITIIFGIAQLPENIIAISLFKRVRKCAPTKASKVVYTVFYALSIVMLLVMLLTIGVFFAIIGSN